MLSLITPLLLVIITIIVYSLLSQQDPAALMISIYHIAENVHWTNSMTMTINA